MTIAPPIEVIPWLGFREPFNSFSHLIGAVVFAALAFRLIRLGRGDWVRTTSLIVLAIASVAMLLVSGIYHLHWPGPTRDLLLRMDVAVVFVLIAASMTPVHAILFEGPARWGPLVLIWAVAISGVAWRISLKESSPGTLGVVVFLLFGWSSVIISAVLLHRFGWSFMQPAILSGLAYTIGAICLMFHRPTIVPGLIGPHELWHVAVLCGIGLQWYFVSQFASPLTIPVRIRPPKFRDQIATLTDPVGYSDLPAKTD
ncbi:PAQR family membrane homeostasis protein TrhA [Schlesneria paludicola]|uniref:PAQR family membrane homeostasis protein TrhA n=1 Tax=Schlesneria paludicola TaxID=360056 RepID=UPI000299D8E7|nr:hemolysin III family protein [Schlesneria paludicola]